MARRGENVVKGEHSKGRKEKEISYSGSPDHNTGVNFLDHASSCNNLWLCVLVSDSKSICWPS